MNVNEKKWVVFEGSKFLVNSISGIFISLFLWQLKQEVSIVLLYFLALFIGIPIFGLIASYIAEVYSAKISFFISYLAKGFLLISLLVHPNFFVNNPVLYGFVYAIDTGFFAVPRNAAFQSIVNSENISKITALLGSISTMVGIFVPLAGSLLIVLFGGYNIIFETALFSLCISAVLLVFLKISAGDGDWQIKDVFSAKHSRDFNVLVKTQFVNGVKGGIEWALFGVLTLSLVGNNLPKWGIVTFVIEIVSVLAGVFYIKYLASKKDIPTLLITGLLYAAITIIFVTNFNFTGLIIFLVINAIAGSFMGNANSSVTSGMIREDNKWQSLLNEYWAFIEFPLALGRIIPIVVLLLADISLTNSFWLKVLFLVIGTTPLITTETLRKSYLVANKLKSDVVDNIKGREVI